MNIRKFAKTIKGKIAAIAIGTTLAITLITVSVCFFVFHSLLRRSQIQSVEFGLQLVANNVSSDMKDILYFSRWCTSSNDILKYLETFHDKAPLAVASKEDKSLRTIALSSSDRLKEEYRNTNRHVSRVIVSNNTTSNYLQVLSGSGDTPSYTVASLAESQVFKALLESPAIPGQAGIINDPFYQNFQEAPVIPIVRPISDTYGKQNVGWVYLSVSATIITDYLKSLPLPEDSRLYLTMGDHFYQIQNGHFIEMLPDFTILSLEQVENIDPGTLVQKIRMDDARTETLITHSLGQDGWYLHQILSRQQLNKQRQVYLLLIAAICAAILSLGSFMVLLLNRTISQPVARIRKKINDIAQGDFSRDPSIEWEHEFGEIGKGINTLAFDVVNLMEKRIDDEKQKKDLEYQILQSQINPHFLYNALNSIKWMATIQGSSGIAEMTTALARLLRQVSKGSSSMIPLEEEINLVKDYFLIQQYRYGGSVTIEYQIESDELYRCLVHRFSLQPIVENALFHGIEPKGSTGNIVVKAWSTSDGEHKNLHISITDNGIGMSPETIEKVLTQNPTEKNADFFRQVGIANVNQRIRHQFGASYGISIDSQLGAYTTMTLLVPYITQETS